MRKIKKGYIIIAVLIAASYFYMNYQESLKREHFTKLAQDIVTQIRYQDYFFLQNSLKKELQDKISLEDIRNFLKHYHFSRAVQFKLKEYEKNATALKLIGSIEDKNRSYPSIMVFLEQNGSVQIEFLEINTIKLKPREFSFPIVMKRQEQNSSLKAPN